MVSKIFPTDELSEQTLDYARRIAELPTIAALLIKESVNQTVDNMGFYNSLQACFTLHQLNHSHWAEVHENRYPVARSRGRGGRLEEPAAGARLRARRGRGTLDQAPEGVAAKEEHRAGRAVYIARFAESAPDRAAVVMGGSGRRISYQELTKAPSASPACSTTCGLRRGDHYAVLLENHPSYFEIVWAGMRSGLYITAVNSHLTAAEAGYIVADCGAKVLVTSAALARGGRRAGGADTPAVEHRFMVDGTTAFHDSYEEAVAGQSAAPR